MCHRVAIAVQVARHQPADNRKGFSTKVCLQRAAYAIWLCDLLQARQAVEAATARRLDACEGVAATLMGAFAGGGSGGCKGKNPVRAALAAAFSVSSACISSRRRTHRSLEQALTLARLAAETAVGGPAALLREHRVGPAGLERLASLLVQHAAHAHAEAIHDEGSSAEAAMAIEALLGAAETVTGEE